MGVPTSEVGYTPAMSSREDLELCKDMWWHWTKKKSPISLCNGFATQSFELFLRKNKEIIDKTNILRGSEVKRGHSNMKHQVHAFQLRRLKVNL
jgi:hypothetical protein